MSASFFAHVLLNEAPGPPVSRYFFFHSVSPVPWVPGHRMPHVLGTTGTFPTMLYVVIRIWETNIDTYVPVGKLEVASISSFGGSVG